MYLVVRAGFMAVSVAKGLCGCHQRGEEGAGDVSVAGVGEGAKSGEGCWTKSAFT